jgi:hypothetical protein
LTIASGTLHARQTVPGIRSYRRQDIWLGFIAGLVAAVLLDLALDAWNAGARSPRAGAVSAIRDR